MTIPSLPSFTAGQPTTQPTTQPAARLIGHWLAGLERAGIPDDVASAARACIIDTLGVALAGVGTDTARLARGEALDIHAAGPSTLLGGGRLCAEGAAFANTAAAHALDFDDNSYAGFVHGSAVVVPTALAAVEAAGGTGADLLTAVVAGAEAEYALAVALGNGVYEAGWWTTALFGVVGAAATAAKAFRLDGDRAADAVAFALCGAGGMRACFGTGAKPLLAAQAAANGLRAARLAKRGGAVPHVVGGLCPAGGAGPLRSHGADGLGPAVAPAGPGHRHQGLSGLPLLARGGRRGARPDDGAPLPPSDITAVRCVVPPLVAANLTYDRPTTPGEARFSLPFAVACVMLHGDLTLDHLTTATLADPHLHAAMERVSMRPDPGWNADPDRARLAPEGADVTVETATGRTFRRFCASARGTVARPLSAQEHAGKFHDCAGRAMGPEAAARLHRKLLDIDALPRLDGLLDGSIG
ncbi:MmgE/PrpD family protein [Azospirillum brasilense]|uniref:MmgE/PrpD family protein n=1 Tax=Azospirillum brasilense TaxID=192 RepID=UPI0003A627E4|nr:MmgE/PrpD family protein [Azospirillum brasilense]